MIDYITLNDLFHTEQGEGYHWGRRSLFIRVPYCNLKCSWCDTEFNSFNIWNVEDFKRFIEKEPSRFAVITGGEPMMNKHVPKIIDILKSYRFEIACETNGCFPIFQGIDFVTVSPKRDSNYFINDDIILKANELKLVIDKGFDFSILKGFELLFKDNKNIRYTLSPEFNNLENSFKEIENYIKDNPKWRYSLQTHKFLNIK